MLGHLMLFCGFVCVMGGVVGLVCSLVRSLVRFVLGLFGGVACFFGGAITVVGALRGFAAAATRGQGKASNGGGQKERITHGSATKQTACQLLRECRARRAFQWKHAPTRRTQTALARSKLPRRGQSAGVHVRFRGCGSVGLFQAPRIESLTQGGRVSTGPSLMRSRMNERIGHIAWLGLAGALACSSGAGGRQARAVTEASVGRGGAPALATNGSARSPRAPLEYHVESDGDRSRMNACHASAS